MVHWNLHHESSPSRQYWCGGSLFSESRVIKYRLFEGTELCPRSLLHMPYALVLDHLNTFPIRFVVIHVLNGLLVAICGYSRVASIQICSVPVASIAGDDPT